jgi:hypothetical protein
VTASAAAAAVRSEALMSVTYPRMPRLELLSGDVCRIGPSGCAGWVLRDAPRIGTTRIPGKKRALRLTDVAAPSIAAKIDSGVVES